MTYEEFYTLLTQIEAMLNSRALCQLSSDANDINALTPGHFLIDRPLNAVPEPSLLNTNKNRPNSWQLLEKLSQDFWRTWSRDYLCELQQRPKGWSKVECNLKVDDIVIVKDDRLPPAKWFLVRTIETHPGADGILRVITIKHQNGILKIPANKVCKRPID